MSNLNEYALNDNMPVKQLSGYTGGSISDSDFENLSAHKDLTLINLKAIEDVITSDDKVYAFTEYKKGAAKRIWDSKYPPLIVSSIKDHSTEASFISYIVDLGFPKFKNSDEIVAHMTKKLEKFKEILNKYKKMILTNPEHFGVNKKEAAKLINQINSGRYENISSKLFIKLNANRDLWVKKWGLDFTKFGGGLVFGNSYENLTGFRTPETFFNMSMEYEVIVDVHGTDITSPHHLSTAELNLAKKIKEAMAEMNESNASLVLKSLYDSLTKEEKEIVDRYKIKDLLKYYECQMGDLGRYYSKNFLLAHRTMRYYLDRLSGDIKKDWGFGQPLETPYGTFRDVNEFIRESVRQGYKKIKILACNPGHYELAEDIKNMPDVVVSHSLYSVYVENVNLL